MHSGFMDRRILFQDFSVRKLVFGIRLSNLLACGLGIPSTQTPIAIWKNAQKGGALFDERGKEEFTIEEKFWT